MEGVVRERGEPDVRGKAVEGDHMSLRDRESDTVKVIVFQNDRGNAILCGTGSQSQIDVR